MYNVIAFAAILLEQLGGGVDAVGWSSVAVSLVLALGFAWALMAQPEAS